MNRRSALITLTAVFGGIAAAIASIPFFRYFLPSERAKALGAAISVDLTAIQPGQIHSYQWRGLAVLVMHREAEQIENIALSNDHLQDRWSAEDLQPDYVDPVLRSTNPQYLVVIGNCSHLGCVPNEDAGIGKEMIGDWWPGGFHCPCHHSFYDYAGRIVTGPAPRNLTVPPHWFPSENELIVGEDQPPVDA